MLNWIKLTKDSVYSFEINKNQFASSDDVNWVIIQYCCHWSKIITLLSISSRNIQMNWHVAEVGKILKTIIIMLTIGLILSFSKKAIALKHWRWNTTCECAGTQLVIPQSLCKSLGQCIYWIAFSLLGFSRDHPNFGCLCWYKVHQKQHDIHISADDQHSFNSLIGSLTRMEYQPCVSLFMVSLQFDFAARWPRICSIG